MRATNRGFHGARSLCLVAAPAMALCGCFAPPAIMIGAGVSAAQSGVASYINRELYAATGRPLDETYQAMLGAAEELDFTVRTARLEGTSGFIQLEDARGMRTTVRMEARTAVVTTVRVRVGVLGDRMISALLVKVAQQRMGEGIFNYDGG